MARTTSARVTRAHNLTPITVTWLLMKCKDIFSPFRVRFTDRLSTVPGLLSLNLSSPLLAWRATTLWRLYGAFWFCGDMNIRLLTPTFFTAMENWSMQCKSTPSLKQPSSNAFCSFADSNGSTPEVIGEGSYVLGQKCFPTENISGDNGHGTTDVTCKLLPSLSLFETQSWRWRPYRYRVRQSAPYVCLQQQLHHELRHAEIYGRRLGWQVGRAVEPLRGSILFIEYFITCGFYQLELFMLVVRRGCQWN